MKLISNLVLGLNRAALAEGLAFGLKAGLNMEDVVAVISKGAAQSWQMDNRAKTMCDGKFDFGFATNWMRKDLRLCLEEARRNGARLPVLHQARRGGDGESAERDDSVGEVRPVLHARADGLRRDAKVGKRSGQAAMDGRRHCGVSRGERVDGGQRGLLPAENRHRARGV